MNAAVPLSSATPLCTTGNGTSLVTAGWNSCGEAVKPACRGRGTYHRAHETGSGGRHFLMGESNQVPAALAAFVRGVERRAWLFLWLQGGREEAAGRALAAGIRAFQAQASRLPMAQWPDRFWRLLAASPVEGGQAHWPAPLEALGGLEPVPRRALLLRLAAGLDEVPAAEALGVVLEEYREQLGRACPRDGSGQVDAQAWYALAQAVQQVARELPPRRLLQIAELREAALLPGVPVATERPARERNEAKKASPPPRRRRWPWVVLVLLACALALAATLWWAPGQLPGPGRDGQAVAPDKDLGVHDNGPILVEELPAGPSPGGLPAEPPVLEETVLEPQVRDLDWLSWYAAGAPASRIDREAGDAAAVPPPLAAGGGGDRQRLAAWQALPADEQARVMAAEASLAALPAEERAALRERFAGLDAMEQRGWWLGPSLGADWAVLQPLFGYVGEDEPAALLAALRDLPPPSRAQLGELGRRTPADARAALRAELLAVAPVRRAEWIAQRSRR